MTGRSPARFAETKMIDDTEDGHWWAGAARESDAYWSVIAVLTLAETTVSLQQTMVVPLLPGSQRLLDVSTGNVSWSDRCPIRRCSTLPT
jgi:hypothetical protein